MTLQILVIPCLRDNYAYLLHDQRSGASLLVDVPEAKPILTVLSQTGWRLDHVALTHHHNDHIGGLPQLLAHHPAQVVGARADAHRLPALDLAVAESDELDIGAERGRVLEVPGHTTGHIAFHFPQSQALFSGDSLMVLGCGRVFEGTMEQMFTSLSKLAELPAETLVYSGHEYALANAGFASSVDPDNAALAARAAAIAQGRARGHPSVPAKLAEEQATNPFLRAGDASIQATLGMTGAHPTLVFAELRTRKDLY